MEGTEREKERERRECGKNEDLIQEARGMSDRGRTERARERVERVGEEDRKAERATRGQSSPRLKPPGNNMHGLAPSATSKGCNAITHTQPRVN